MNISSPAFGHKQPIPIRYTCEGKNVNPPLNFSGHPAKTMSLVLIVSDPDAPSGAYTHWLVYNISPRISGIKENSVPAGCLQGGNSAGRTRYDGPCPPNGTHHYVFRLYALDAPLGIGGGASKQTLESVMHGHILDRAELIGIYQKVGKQ